MTKQKSVADFLAQKMDVLEHLEVNSQWQERYIREGNNKGLLRTLRHRAEWLDKLAEVNKELEQAAQDQNMQALSSQMEALKCKQQTVLSGARQAIQTAEMEKNRIFAELGLLRKKKHLKTHYLNPYAAVVPGRRINRKG